MAFLISAVTGNFSSASTWQLASASTGAAIDTEFGTTALTTSPLASASFVLAAQEVDAVLVKLVSRGVTLTPTNTITVQLYNSTGAAVAGTCTIDVADLPPCVSGGLSWEGGWYCFVFSGGPITPNGTDSYTIRAFLSATSPAVGLSRLDGTAANWTRLVRRTTTAAPAAGDKLIIIGTHTGTGGAGTTVTVTVDNNSTTQYGVSGFNRGTPSICVGKRGILWASRSTNTQLRWTGPFIVYHGGILDYGTIASPIPWSVTAILEIVMTGDGTEALGSRVGGVITMHGSPPTDGNNTVWTLLTADAAAAATSVTVANNTGWKSGSVVGIAPTTRTRTHTSLMTLSGDATATTLAFTAGTANAHLGTAPKQAEVVLLTRNVKYRSTVTTFAAGMEIAGQWDIRWTEFRYVYNTQMDLDNPLTGVAATSGEVLFEYCSFYDCESNVIVTSDVGNAPNTSLIVRHVVAFNVCTGGGNFLWDSTMGSGAGQVWIADDVVIINCGGTGVLWERADSKTFANIRVAGAAQWGVALGTNTSGFSGVAPIIGPYNLHACSSGGLNFYTGNTIPVSVGAITAWRNNGSGCVLGGGISNGYGVLRDVTFESITVFGNSSVNVTFDYGSSYKVRIKSLISNSDTTGFTTQTGITFVAGYLYNVQFDDAVFGAIIPHSSYDVSIYTFTVAITQITFNRVVFGAAQPINWPNPDGFGSPSLDSFISIGRYGGVAGDARISHGRGTLIAEHTIAETDPSLKMTPVSATKKLDSAAFRYLQGFVVGAVAGQTRTVSVRVRKSATYNGNQPRLIRRASRTTILHDEDQVLASASAAVDTWETLTGTSPTADVDGVFEFVVDCDGTVGSVYVDSWDA